jgi:peptide-methionine (S)-S-oxide reductase
MNPVLVRSAAVAAVSLLAITQPSGPATARSLPRAEPATALFAGGCFWSMERPFDQLRGVVAVSVGYTGGHTKNPSYEEVSSGRTGHLEAVQVSYDPATISYEKLVDAFWHNIDPVSPDGQFCDFGPQYRTAIFYRDSAQRRVAEESKRQLEASARFGQPIATAIQPATEFYRAEEYHQHYYRKNPVRYNLYRVGCGRDRRLAEVWGPPSPAAATER